MSTYPEEFKALEEENKRLREVLEKYGQHNAKCREQMLYDSRCGMNQRCICGLEQAVEKYK